MAKKKSQKTSAPIPPILRLLPNTPKSQPGKASKYAKLFWPFWILLLIALALYAHIFLKYGGLQGYRLESARFPGIESAEIASVRDNTLAYVNDLNGKMGPNSDMAATYASPLQTADLCVKGKHDNIKITFKGRYDNWAYRCEIATMQYFVYDKLFCEVAAGLAAQKLPFMTYRKKYDCRQSVPEIDEGLSSFYYDDPTTAHESYPELSHTNFSLKDLDEFNISLGPYGTGFPRPFFNCSYNIERTAYCSDKQVDKQYRQEILLLPAESSRTIIEANYDKTYYEK